MQVAVVAGEVSDQSARFAHQQFTRREIPRFQTNFKVAINAACGDVRQIQRSGAGATEIGTLRKQLGHDVHISWGVLFELEGETGGKNGAIQIASDTAAQAVTIQLRALSAYGAEQFITHRIVNDSHFCTAFNTNGDRNREVGQAFNKVGGAIQRIDYPLNILIFALKLTAFFSDDGMFWVRFTNDFDNQAFCVAVNIRYEVVAAFLAGLDSVRGFIILGN
ncbi:hypothetical protein PAJ_2160 [Pantoea ananatis AJ13355]|uniref:Uncharacterized protein n=1 Tax=Pantoea ananatis (strain AJ13355) TaxID=932677 RepID=A0A0H3KYV3_PANAA|nr:hypothetical protein PAJ_2160 [Pantoea ananatis AJ13355]